MVDWRIFTVVAFGAWLSLGVAFGAWLGSARHGFQPGAFHVQSLYDSHATAPQAGALVVADAARVVRGETAP